MFQQLPESNAIRRPRWGGSIVSTTSHALLITAAVALTARAGERPAAPPEVHVPYVEVATAKPLPDAPRVARHDANAAPSAAVPSNVPIVPTITEIPIGLPDINLSAHTDLTDVVTRPRGGGQGTGTATIGDRAGDAARAWNAEQVDKAVVLAPGSPTPRYPDMLRQAGVSGTVMIEFVVDTLGHVENGSGSVVTTDHEQFTMSVRAVLPRLRFLPAEAQGRKVRQLVRLPFRFDLHS